MLRNPRYVGDNTYGGEVVGPAAWPAVFDRATWEALQAAMPRVQQAPHGKKAKSMLAGIARCGRCDAPMASSGWTGRQAYRCNQSVGGCGKTTHNRAIVDEWVSRELLEYFSSEVLASERVEAKDSMRRAHRALQEVMWRIDAARTAHSEDRLDGRDFYPIYDGLRRQRETLTRQLAEARIRVEAAEKAETARKQWETWSLEDAASGSAKGSRRWSFGPQDKDIMRFGRAILRSSTYIAETSGEQRRPRPPSTCSCTPRLLTIETAVTRPRDCCRSAKVSALTLALRRDPRSCRLG